MHFYTHEDVKKAVTLGKLKIMKHPTVHTVGWYEWYVELKNEIIRFILLTKPSIIQRMVGNCLITKCQFLFPWCFYKYLQEIHILEEVFSTFSKLIWAPPLTVFPASKWATILMMMSIFLLSVASGIFFSFQNPV